MNSVSDDICVNFCALPFSIPFIYSENCRKFFSASKKLPNESGSLIDPKGKAPEIRGLSLTQFDAVKTFFINRLFIDGDF